MRLLRALLRRGDGLRRRLRAADRRRGGRPPGRAPRRLVLLRERDRGRVGAASAASTRATASGGTTTTAGVTPRIPAVVGAFPEPFLSGNRGQADSRADRLRARRPRTPCDEVVRRLDGRRRHQGEQGPAGRLGRRGRGAHRASARWTRHPARPGGAADRARAGERPASTPGIDRAGNRMTCSRATATLARTLGAGAGLVAATQHRGAAADLGDHGHGRGRRRRGRRAGGGGRAGGPLRASPSTRGARPPLPVVPGTEEQREPRGPATPARLRRPTAVAGRPGGQIPCLPSEDRRAQGDGGGRAARRPRPGRRAPARRPGPRRGRCEPGAGAAAGLPDGVRGRGGRRARRRVGRRGRRQGRAPERGGVRARCTAAQCSSPSSPRSTNGAGTRALAASGATAFAMEAIPRISRAQSMDALSSQATVAGYRAVLIGAQEIGRFFPMLMTAAGTSRPPRCSCSARASRGCRRSPPRAASARWSPASTSARPSASRSSRSARGSSTSRAARTRRPPAATRASSPRRSSRRSATRSRRRSRARTSSSPPRSCRAARRRGS